MTDRSELNYGTYLMVDELLELQRPRSEPEHPDELLFIVVHQASELWYKVMLHELQSLTVAAVDMRLDFVTVRKMSRAGSASVTKQMAAISGGGH